MFEADLVSILPHDPTPDEVAAAIATLQAFEAAREMHVGGAVPVEPVTPSESPAVAAEVSTDAPIQVSTDAPIQVFVESTPAAPVPAALESPVVPSESTAEPVAAVPPVLISATIPALCMARFVQFNDVASAYLAWHPSAEHTQHESDAAFRAFDREQLDKLTRVLAT